MMLAVAGLQLSFFHPEYGSRWLLPAENNDNSKFQSVRPYHMSKTKLLHLQSRKRPKMECHTGPST